MLKRHPTAPWLLRHFTAGTLTAWLLVNQTIAAQEAEFEQDRLSLPLTFDTAIPEISNSRSGLEPEEIDRAVLNRLMQEIVSAPQRTASITGLEAETLEKMEKDLVQQIRDIEYRFEKYADVLDNYPEKSKDSAENTNDIKDLLVKVRQYKKHTIKLMRRQGMKDLAKPLGRVGAGLDPAMQVMQKLE